MNDSVGSGNQIQALWKGLQALLTSEPALQTPPPSKSSLRDIAGCKKSFLNIYMTRTYIQNKQRTLVVRARNANSQF